MQPNVNVVDRDVVDVTKSLLHARRYGLLAEATAPFVTQTVQCHTGGDGTVVATVTLAWPDGRHTTGTAKNSDPAVTLFDAYRNATSSVAAKIASVHSVASDTVLLEGGLGAEPASQVVLRCHRDDQNCVAIGTHTDVYEAAWQAVSDIYTWVLMYD